MKFRLYGHAQFCAKLASILYSKNVSHDIESNPQFIYDKQMSSIALFEQLDENNLSQCIEELKYNKLILINKCSLNLENMKRLIPLVEEGNSRLILLHNNKLIKYGLYPLPSTYNVLQYKLSINTKSGIDFINIVENVLFAFLLLHKGNINQFTTFQYRANQEFDDFINIRFEIHQNVLIDITIECITQRNCIEKNIYSSNNFFSTKEEWVEDEKRETEKIVEEIVDILQEKKSNRNDTTMCYHIVEGYEKILNRIKKVANGIQ